MIIMLAAGIYLFTLLAWLPLLQTQSIFKAFSMLKQLSFSTSLKKHII